MSRESARSLVDRMKSDTAFAAAIMAAPSLATRMDLIRSGGFDCAADEIGALGALGDGEMDGIAGGACRVVLPPGT